MDYTRYVIEQLYKLSLHGFDDFVTLDDKDIDGFKLDLQKAKNSQALNNVRELIIDKTGKVTIKLYDSLEILALLDKASQGSQLTTTENLTLEDIIKAKNNADSQRD